MKNDLATGGYGNQDGELAFCNRRRNEKKNKKQTKKNKPDLISRLARSGDVVRGLADNTRTLEHREPLP